MRVFEGGYPPHGKPSTLSKPSKTSRLVVEATEQGLPHGSGQVQPWREAEIERMTAQLLDALFTFGIY